MAKGPLLLIFLSVTVTAVAQLVLKAAMISPSVQRAITGGNHLKAVTTVILDPLIVIGLLLYFAAAIVWLLVLSKVPVSLAYPFVAFGFVLTGIMGRVLFHEMLSLQKLIGILLICLGVVFLARG